MAVSPINLTRITQSLQSNFTLRTLRETQRELAHSQSQIASGRRFVAASEDPVSAARALDFTQALAQQDQLIANLRYADDFLAAADSALTEVNELLTQAVGVASQNVSNLTSAAEREAEAEVVAAIRMQIQAVGNRQFAGRYLFAGRSTANAPFVDSAGIVSYVGDTGDLLTRVGSDATVAMNIPGSVVFGALSGRIAADIDLTPRLTGSVRLDDLAGATGQGIVGGTLVFYEAEGAGRFAVDLGDADTMGDVAAAINQAATAAGSTLTASVGDQGLVLTPGDSAVSVTDVAAGAVASKLGILTTQATAHVIRGQALGPRLTRVTPVTDLAGGSGIDLANGLIVTNGTRSATIDLSAATTVQDIINIINNAGVMVRAEISDDGTRIDVFNEASGTALTIGENGGTTATDLGIRTFDTATPLQALNFGRGVGIVAGEEDLSITAGDGSTFGVNLDDAATVGDVIARINDSAQSAGVAVTASFAQVGNGIRLVDETGGAGQLTVGGANLSPAAADLGLAGVTATEDGDLTGVDVNPTRTDGVIGALIDLEAALRGDDTQAIAVAGGRLDELQAEATRMHGIVGARAQGMSLKRTQMEDAAASTEIFLSNVQDLDYTEAVVALEAAMTQLQANLQVSSSVMSLSLLDYLG
jgi:flagellar hook-associated protein 3 FlgL